MLPYLIFNFVFNKPGNDFIPYWMLALGQYGVETASGKKLAGPGAIVGIGMNWFPFSEIFAFNVQASYGSVEIEDNGTPKTELELKQSHIAVGSGIYF